ncbi:hypothetical protein T492DRAFT_865761 [Pavlovales sp. CCMP2436]|nr:hypothetical protein T492DRAFT_865761 [Pavlovales sp. CCMP2436]
MFVSRFQAVGLVSCGIRGCGVKGDGLVELPVELPVVELHVEPRIVLRMASLEPLRQAATVARVLRLPAVEPCVELFVAALAKLPVELPVVELHVEPPIARARFVELRVAALAGHGMAGCGQQLDLPEAGRNEAAVAKRMAVSAPRLTRLCECERISQHEAEVEFKLCTAETVKVMHNLRSPLLSVANAVAIVQDRDPKTRVDDSEPHAAGCDAAAVVVLRTFVVLEVVDSGFGLTVDELHVLNQGEAFTQVGLGQLQGSGGTDLGLAIARDLLRLHGPGHGSTFWLELTLPEAPEGTTVSLEDSPMLEDSRTAVAGTHAEGMPGAVLTGHRARAFCVLHVEDNAVLRKTFELRVPKKLGVIFDVAVNGAKAEKREYALVLMDNQVCVTATALYHTSGLCCHTVVIDAAGLSFCVDKDTPGIHRIAQVIGSFELDEALDEEPGAGSSSSLTELPTRKASLAAPQPQLP